jgi:hypothetical protein
MHSPSVIMDDFHVIHRSGVEAVRCQRTPEIWPGLVRSQQQWSHYTPAESQATHITFRFCFHCCEALMTNCFSNKSQRFYGGTTNQKSNFSVPWGGMNLNHNLWSNFIHCGKNTLLFNAASIVSTSCQLESLSVDANALIFAQSDHSDKKPCSTVRVPAAAFTLWHTFQWNVLTYSPIAR